ncbi:MAG: gliding motility-associated C-terminal domain-containing protein [Saprospiraceae bacterium]|nr:gliding motility-associated C-terminal domain-containing protein [Saprospiraceae bacterium]
MIYSGFFSEGQPLPIKRRLFIHVLSFIVIFTLLLNPFSLSAQDTQPPVITNPAQDSAIICGSNSDLITALTQWYLNAAGAVATDDSGGTIVFSANLTLNQVITIFNTSSDTLCGNTQSVTVSFVAADEAGNSSVSTTARFYTFDNIKPQLVIPANVSISCVPGIRDTLINWIKNKAGYNATDNCSNTLNWTNFQYSITSGNIVIQSGGGSIATGPYPTIPNALCNWRVNINFFVSDECGNQSITPGTTSFTVTDNIAPTLSARPSNIIVRCDSIPPIPAITATDACTQSPVVNFSDSSTQDPDSTSCSHFNYTITRVWTATDNCNNVAIHTQTITVTDTVAPVFTGQNTVSLSCITFMNQPDTIILTQIKDNCSKVNISFSDSPPVPSISACSYNFTRTYTLQDVCNNTRTFSQQITIINNVPPVLINPARNRHITCQDAGVAETLFETWINENGSSVFAESCSPFKSFAAVPGSYSLQDTLTFPGAHPGSLNTSVCPSDLQGFLRHETVDFVFYDRCGNAIVTTATFGIRDSIAPLITNCTSAQLLNTDPDNCFATLTLPVPDAVDDCIETISPVVRVISVPVNSSMPGNNETIVDSVTMRIGPFNPATIIPIEDAELVIEFRNLDIDDAPEYFHIKDEDRNIIGRSPNGVGQCSSSSITLSLDKNKVVGWIADGYIEIHFIPNIQDDSPILSINDICGNSSINTTINFEIDLSNTVQKSYSLNGNPEITLNAENELSLILAPGNHEVVFNLKDCAANISQCIIPVTIEDKTPPLVSCPSDQIFTLSIDKCDMNVEIPFVPQVTEACNGNRIYDRTIPSSKEASLISFLYDDNTERHLARNRQFIFPQIFPVRYLNKEVIIDVEIFGDVGNTGESFDIFSSTGTLIGNTTLHGTTSKCDLSKTRFQIPVSVFNSWLSNDQLTLTAIPKSGSQIEGGGINPCKTLSPTQTTDGESYIQIRIQYTDAQFTVQSSGATVIPEGPVTEMNGLLNMTLNAGISLITLTTSDHAGNKGSCTFQIDLKDTQKPVASCKNSVITISPTGTENHIITIGDIDNGSTDNCGVTDRVFIPSSVNCAMVGDVTIKMLISDSAGNQDSCNAMVRVRTMDILPTFSSGLCENDTLKLFANPPFADIPGTFTFRWTGPSDLEFFEENPFIPNVNASFNGLYKVTVTGFNGCSAEGSVLVNIQPLTNPAITTESVTICENSDLILNSTQFTGSISYEWYEGVFPAGVLIQKTSVSNIILNPNVGVHFYYVIAQGEGCRSNPSAFIRITVLKVPDPIVENTFLTPCEGDAIVLGTNVVGVGYSYHWTGPAGYDETGQFPRIIQNAGQSNAGNYILTIKNGICTSENGISTVVVLEKPQKPEINGLEVICQGATFSLVATNSSGADSYDWYKDNTLFRTTAQNNLTIPNAQLPLQGSWQVVAVKGSCRSDISVIRNIGIINILEIGATNSGPACDGDSIRLQATFVPNASYKWSGPVANIPSVQDPLIPAVPGEYSVTITTPSLCDNNASTIVTTITKPQITALSNDAQNCMDGNTPIKFSPSVFPPQGDYTYLWTSTNGFSSSERNPIIQNAGVQDTGVYFLTIFNQSCASNIASTHVSFSAIPLAPSLDTNDFFCAGDSIVLNVISGESSAEFIWTTPTGIILTQVPSLVVLNISSLNSGNYSLVIRKNGCQSMPSAIRNIEVRPKPIVPQITTDSTVCFGSPFSLSTFPDQNTEYIWTGPSFSSNEKNPVIPSATKANEGIYTLQTGLNGCFSDNVASVKISVRDKIETPLLSQQFYSLCASENSAVELCILTETLTPGSLVNIVNSVNSEILLSGNQLCYIFDNVDLLVNGTNLIYTVASVENCLSEISPLSAIQLNTPPDLIAETTEGNLIICPGEFATLISKDGPPQVEISWSSPDTDVRFTSQTDRSVVVSNLKNGNNIILLDYSIPGCRNFSRDTTFIAVEFQPLVMDDLYETSYNQSIQMNVLSNDQVPQNIELVITQQPAHGILIQNGNLITYTPDPRYTDDVSFTYRVCGFYCEDLCMEGRVFITIKDVIDCFAPNIITPNQDGINDQFIIPCLSNGNYPSNKLYIFNEWGAEVFSASPYKNDWQGTFGDKQLPSGTYFYVLDIGTGGKPINGFLIIQI